MSQPKVFWQDLEPINFECFLVSTAAKRPWEKNYIVFLLCTSQELYFNCFTKDFSVENSNENTKFSTKIYKSRLSEIPLNWIKVRACEIESHDSVALVPAISAAKRPIFFSHNVCDFLWKLCSEMQIKLPKACSRLKHSVLQVSSPNRAGFQFSVTLSFYLAPHKVSI